MSQLRHAFLILAALCLVSSEVHAADVELPAPIREGNYQLIFKDEFDGPADAKPDAFTVDCARVWQPAPTQIEADAKRPDAKRVTNP